MRNIFWIYDLDGTVIDSSHRYRNKPCGSIDLDYWFENMTPEKIAQDCVIDPLASQMRRQIYAGENVIICTARTMDIGDHNEDFLLRHGLWCEHILNRPNGDMSSDADLKEFALDEFFMGLGYENGLDDVKCVMYEDNMTVVNRLRTRGVFMRYVGA